ncbi:unnamed protein product [Phytophthora fragariaefolia]|uniref:Unnamed protein product n=1 Tax=Phytophthora fragariaefolia TaxID=1490495 RepID=A0A9W6X3V5_9STRA|nr:unnamed protein product [Phytophthora fragariaefolia]
MQVIAARKHPPLRPATPECDPAVGKRKREVEVIVIDDDDEEEDGLGAHIASTPNQTSQPQIDSSARPMYQPSLNTTGNAGVEDALVRPSHLFSQLQVPPQIGPGETSVFHNSMIQPVAFPAELTGEMPSPIVQTSLAHNSSAMLNVASINEGVGSAQWNNAVPQFATSASSLGSSTSTASFVTNSSSNGMMDIPPSAVPTSASTGNGIWSTTSAIITDLASVPNTTNLLPLGGAVFAENALVDSLVDRYHEVNQAVTNLELQTEQLTRQIAIATCQGPYAATPLMTVLSGLQPLLASHRARRDNLFVAMIIQSADIMASVRLLRLTELGDVPQVPMISHRKCLQISNEINQHKRKLIQLNQELTEMLNQSHAFSSGWEVTHIRTTSANIQMHENNIKKLKKDREVEIVRIVQFSRSIRETLKKAFQRTVELQQQHQQFR